jgi:hypothetical protein
MTTVTNAMLYRYSSAIVSIAETCHYVPDYVLCRVERRAAGSHLKVGDFVVVELPLSPVGENDAPTAVVNVPYRGPKVLGGSASWSKGKGGKTAEVISFGDTERGRRRMATHDQRVMRRTLADKAPTGRWASIEADRQSETEARKIVLRWARMCALPDPKGPITAADFRFGSLMGDKEARPVRSLIAA